MILGFRHRGLEQLFEKGDRRRIAPSLIAKVERVLARLDVAAKPKDLDTCRASGYTRSRVAGRAAGL